jgi:cell division protein FtsL
MSTLMNQARNRVPRFAEAAVERARLTVVPRSTGRRAARVPFVTLVSVLLLGGVAGLLFLNTSMQQVSFTATAMEQRASELEAQRQSLQMELDSLRDPQRVALQAKQMGMVPPASPAFLRLSDGKILGKPTPATYADSIRVTPLRTAKPKSLRQRVVIEKVKAAPKTTRTSIGSAAEATSDGAAAERRTAAAGTKKAHDPGQGSQR